MTRLAIIAVSALVACTVLACGGSASSGPPLDENLLDNPGAEAGGEGHGSLDGWQESGCFSGAEYGSEESAFDAPPSGMATPGSWHFAGGNQLCDDVAAGRQVVRNVDTLIEGSSDLQYEMSGWLGGVGSQADFATLTAWFYAPNGDLIRGDAIGPVTPADRMSQTTMLERSTDGVVPPRTSRIELVLMIKRDSSGDHSGYADELSFVLTEP